MTDHPTRCLAPDRVAAAQAKIARLVNALRTVILGKEQTIDEVVAALLARGHVLLEGLPGLGKTELVKALVAAAVARLPPHPVHARPAADRHHRQPHPPGARRPEGVRLPCRVRSSPTCCWPTRSTAHRPRPRRRCSRRCRSGASRRSARRGALPAPFFVLATQNPIELEGTYPLPEAQLDRFMFKVDIAGVDRAVLEEILAHPRPRRAAGAAAGADAPRSCTPVRRWSTRCTCRGRWPATSRGWSPRRIRVAPTRPTRSARS